MRSLSRFSLCIAMVLVSAAVGARDDGLYTGAGPSAPPVTLANLMESDRFWPFRVTLVQDLVPPGASETLPRIPGVLVRVDSPQTLRMDFGRFGRHQVPVASTDLLERANRVRLGEETKVAPNLVLTLGNKLLGSEGDEVAPVLVARDTDVEAFLCVFADPAAEGFEEVADRLRPFQGREKLFALLLPQGEWRDARVRQRLRELDWTVPFVFDRFSRAYARSIAGEDTSFPHAMLLSPDGRVLARGAVTKDLAPALEAALPAASRNLAKPLPGSAPDPTAEAAR